MKEKTKVSFIGKDKKASLTPEEKIVAAQTRVAQSMDVFRKAEEDVKAAQHELAIVIANAKEEIEAQTKIIEKAEAEFNYNEKIGAKLSEFRGEQE